MKKLPLGLVGFLQALGVAAYCSLVSLLFWRGNEWFGKVPNYLGPLLFLILFAASALICALISLGYPVFLIWKKQQTEKALRLVAYTAGWLVIFVLLVILAIILR